MVSKPRRNTRPKRNVPVGRLKRVQTFVGVRRTPLGDILSARSYASDEERVYAVLAEVLKAREQLRADKSESVLFLLDLVHVQAILIERLVAERSAAIGVLLGAAGSLRTSTARWFSPIERLASVLTRLRGSQHLETVRKRTVEERDG